LGIRRIKHTITAVYTSPTEPPSLAPFPTDSSPFRHQLTHEAPAFNIFQPNSHIQPNSQPAASSKGAAKQMMVVSWSQSKSRVCGGARSSGSTAVRRLGRGRFILQMRQNPLDDHWVFNAGDDLDLPRTALAGLDIDPNAAQLNTRLSHCIQVIALSGRLVRPFSPWIGNSMKVPSWHTRVDRSGAQGMA
jgi:hypothetical protein